MRIEMKKYDKPSQELEQSILSHIQKSGFPLEWEIREQILKASEGLSLPCDILPKYMYKDPEENILRENDIFWFVDSIFDWETPVSPKFGIGWNYYIECKQSEKYSWIFFTEARDSVWHLRSFNMQTLSILPEVFSDTKRELGQNIHYGRTKNISSSCISFPDNPNQIRSAIYQAVKPSYVEQSDFFDDLESGEHTQLAQVDLYFPVVVYDGNMFEYRYNNKVWELYPAKHVVFVLKEKFSANDRPLTFIIDIVRADYFQQYLENQVLDIKAMCDYVEKKKPKIEPLSTLFLDK